MFFFFFFKQKTAYEIGVRLVGSEMCIRDSLLMCAKAGYQGVLMAPTEVLATQHYESFMELLSPYGIRIALLTGSTKAKEKRETYQKIKDGEIDLSLIHI